LEVRAQAWITRLLGRCSGRGCWLDCQWCGPFFLGASLRCRRAGGRESSRHGGVR
jgi:hypothetical protein